jgi:hypothetical protein
VAEEDKEKDENVITEVRQSPVYPSGQVPEKVQVGLVPGESVQLHLESKTVVGEEPEVSPPDPTTQPDAKSEEDEDEEPQAKKVSSSKPPVLPRKK